MGRSPKGIAAAAIAIAALAGCGGDSDPDATVATEPGGTGTAEETRPEGGPTATGDGRGGAALRRVGEFDQPLYVTQAPGGDELYVVEKEGTVRVVRGGETLAQPFLDIAGEVSSEGEQGLLSIAFDPEFESNGLVYAYYTTSDGSQRVVSYTATRTRVDPGSVTELLLMEDFASNHNGGLLQFGPDGLLYIGTGDGGLADDPERTAQDPDSLLGKILRIDPSPGNARPYRTLPRNPFAGGGGAAEVYSLGLRNPWRFSFDRETGDLAIGDVGQNSLEEIDFVRRADAAGANFGWSAFEGTSRFNTDQEAPGAIPPALEYGRDRGCSVTGGYIVRDPALRSLYGRYLYGDYCAGELRSAVLSPGRARGDRSLGLEVPALSSFGEGHGGRIFVTSLEGSVFRLVAG